MAEQWGKVAKYGMQTEQSLIKFPTPPQSKIPIVSPQDTGSTWKCNTTTTKIHEHSYPNELHKVTQTQKAALIRRIWNSFVAEGEAGQMMLYNNLVPSPTHRIRKPIITKRMLHHTIPENLSASHSSTTLENHKLNSVLCLKSVAFFFGVII